MEWDPLERLTDAQRGALRNYADQLIEFNQHINLISREDETAVFQHHVRHCLYLSWQRFPAGCTVVDWGTGGGLPAIPLAIAFPHVHFVAVDAVEKKVRAVRAMARRVGLSNLDARRGRAEELLLQADYSVSRAAAPLSQLWRWHLRLRSGRGGSVCAAPAEGCWPRGLICLKGGDLEPEMAELSHGVDIKRLPLSRWTPAAYFRDKVIVVCTGEGTDGRRT